MKLSLIMTFLLSWQAHAATLIKPSCAAELQHAAELQPATEMEAIVMELASLKLEVELALARGNPPPYISALDQAFNLRMQSLLNAAGTPGLRAETVAQRIGQAVERLQMGAPRGTTTDLALQQAAIGVDAAKMIFHNVPPGEFHMGPHGEQKFVRITRPFAMQATPVTQIVYKQMLDIAQFPEIILFKAPSAVHGALHPVENLSYLDIDKWLAILNFLARKNHPLLTTVIPDHQPGYFYRLPTEAEWEYVGRALGMHNGNFLFNDPVRLLHYGWFGDYSGGQTYPVGSKFPILVGTSAFYDMYGNVSEVVSDFWSDEITGGEDSKGPDSGTRRVAKGASHAVSVEDATLYWRVPVAEAARAPTLGFRVVREELR